MFNNKTGLFYNLFIYLFIYFQIFVGISDKHSKVNIYWWQFFKKNVQGFLETRAKP
jgi:hypothetical protein